MQQLNIAELTFAEFQEWCEERACDGCWNMVTAVICIEIVAEVLKVKPLFCKKKAREKRWQAIKQTYFKVSEAREFPCTNE